jgi:hypothetical protein
LEGRDVFGDPGNLVDPQEKVYLRQIPRQFRAIPLGQAARDDQVAA